MKPHPKLVTISSVLLTALILIACGQATAVPTPVEEMAPDLALFSPTDIVPTLEGTFSPLLPTAPSVTPTTSPTSIEHLSLPPGESVTPTDTQLPTPTEDVEGTRGTVIPTEPAAGECNPTLEMEAYEAINQRRAEAGVGPLTIDEKLTTAARRYSEDMGINGVWDHIGSDDAGPFKRIHDAGYYYYSAAENISAGHNRGVDAVTAWMNSDGHRINMLNPTYIHIGIACFYIPNDSYSFYWTAVFATP